MRIIAFTLLLALFLLSCKKENIIAQSPVVADVIVNHEMAVQLGYPSDTVYTCYIPNILYGHGYDENNLFGAHGFGDWKDYLMEIRNNRNQVLFKTTDRKLQWTGRESQSGVPPGVYQYYIEIRTGIPDMIHKYTGGVYVAY